MDTINNSQDFKISCRVISATGQPFEIKQLIVEFNLFEDLFNNMTSGNIVINDSQNIINLLSLSGNELILINISKPGIPDWKISKTFRLYRIGDRKLTNNNNESYIMYFASEEMIFSENYRISKSYTNTKISQIVKDITTRFLQIPDNKVNIDETIGIRDIIIPNYKPFESLNWLCTYAVSDEKEDSSYVFFENINGFNFKSILKLLKVKSSWEYTYNLKNIESEISEERIFDVISYEICNAFNSAKLAHEGALTNKLLTIDPLRMKFENTNFNYSEYTSDKKGFATNAVDRNMNLQTSTTLNGAFNMYLTNHNQTNSEYFKDKNYKVNDNKIEINIPYRMAQLSLIRSIRLKIMVPGNPLLTVGDCIKFNLPMLTYRSDSTTKKMDEYYSGEYLITALRHVINQEQKFFTVLEICKDSPETMYPDFNTTNPAYIDSRRYS